MTTEQLQDYAAALAAKNVTIGTLITALDESNHVLRKCINALGATALEARCLQTITKNNRAMGEAVGQ